MKRAVWTLVAAGLILATYSLINNEGEAATDGDYRIRLTGGERDVSPGSNAGFVQELKSSQFNERGVILQFYEIPTETDRNLLAASGITLHSYLPNMSYLATVPKSLDESGLASAGVRWIGALRPEDKIAPALDLMGTPPWSRDSAGVAQFTVKVFGHIAPEDAAGWLRSEYGAIIDGVSKLVNAVALRLPADNWSDMANDERVQWIEPFMPRKELNNSNRINTQSEVVQAVPYSLDGSNVTVGEWDGGHADAV